MPSEANQPAAAMQPESFQPVGTALPGRRWDHWFSWLKHRERGLLLAAAGLQVLVLLAMIAMRLAILARGDTVLLRVTPVDPRDLFRGDYVILSYEFSRVPPGGIQGLSPNWSDEWRDRPVYVTLVPEDDGKHWRMGSVSVNRPASGKYIQGKVKNWGQLEFGIESYFVQEGQGLEYERAVRERRLSAEVALTPDGQAMLRGLKME